MKLQLVPIEFDEACAFIKKHHRHHRPPIGHKFSIAVVRGEEIVGVVIVGRPTNKTIQDGWTLEVVRLATDGTEKSKNACSMLYGAARRAAYAMGYKRLITYILDNEPGTSLAAAGAKCVGEVRGRSWNCKSRPRVDKHPLQNKLRFEL